MKVHLEIFSEKEIEYPDGWLISKDEDDNWLHVRKNGICVASCQSDALYFIETVLFFAKIGVSTIKEDYEDI